MGYIGLEILIFVNLCLFFYPSAFFLAGLISQSSLVMTSARRLLTLKLNSILLIHWLIEGHISKVFIHNLSDVY